MNVVDFEGRTGARQGAPYIANAGGTFSYTTVECLQFLHGREWDQYALAYVHALRPSWVRVTTDGIQCDAQTWRVTVYVTKKGRIKRIEQEVEIRLPLGIKNGYELDAFVR